MEGKQPKTVDEYIRSQPESVQKILEKMRATIRKAAPKAEETISYRMPAYKQNGKYIAFYAAFEKHIGLYPLPDAIEAFKKELSAYKQGKGSIQFPLDKPMPYELVTKIVKNRVKEVS
jgi:uncharacterized protein YdhG (YjbR/CyaY superfamily)